MIRAVFIGEGSSDGPLAGIVVELFRRRGLNVDVTAPDFERLPRRVTKDVEARLRAALRLTSTPVDLFVVHRDADASDGNGRRHEIERAVQTASPEHPFLPVVPIRMTEAWLLLDEQEIRHVSGNPRGRMALDLPDAASRRRFDHRERGKW